MVIAVLFCLTGSSEEKRLRWDIFYGMKYKLIWWKCKRSVFEFVVLCSNHLFGKDLTHRSRLAKWLNSSWHCVLAYLSPARRKQAQFERENPDAPWFVPAAISKIESELRPEFVGFEWGCGRSTLWFAQRVCHITSIEGREEWGRKVLQGLTQKKLLHRVTLLVTKVTSEYEFSQEEVERYAGAINSFPDCSFDFIVVDGHFREACLSKVSKKLRRGGLLIIDNSEVIPTALLDQLRSSDSHVWNNGIWETTIIRNV